MMPPLWKTVWQFLTKLNILLPNDPTNMLLGIYTKKLKTHVHTKTCKRMFIATLLITAKTWKQPICSSVGEWVNCGTSKQCYLALKKKELLSCENTWRKFKCTLLSERSQYEKTVWVQLYDTLEKAKLYRRYQKKKKNQWLPGVRSEGRMNRQSTEDFKGSENIRHDTTVMDTCHYTFVQTHRKYNTKRES